MRYIKFRKRIKHRPRRTRACDAWLDDQLKEGFYQGKTDEIAVQPDLQHFPLNTSPRPGSVNPSLQYASTAGGIAAYNARAQPPPRSSNDQAGSQAPTPQPGGWNLSQQDSDIPFPASIPTQELTARSGSNPSSIKLIRRPAPRSSTSTTHAWGSQAPTPEFGGGNFSQQDFDPPSSGSVPAQELTPRAGSTSSSIIFIRISFAYIGTTWFSHEFTRKSYTSRASPPPKQALRRSARLQREREARAVQPVSASPPSPPARRRSSRTAQKREASRSPSRSPPPRATKKRRK